MPTKKEQLKRVFSRHNIVVFAALATSLASDTATPEDNTEPGLVKDEITLSAIANRPASGSSKGKSSDGDEGSNPEETHLFEFERGDLLKGLQAARIPFLQVSKFFEKYKENVRKDGKISSQKLAKTAKDSDITKEQFVVVVDALREINKCKKLDKVSVKGVNGYDLFEEPVNFSINDKGEVNFHTSLVSNRADEYKKDLMSIDDAISKTKTAKDNKNVIEANNLLVKAFACAHVRKTVENGGHVENYKKLFESFGKELDKHNLKINDEGKLQSREDDKEKTKRIKLEPVLTIWKNSQYRAAG